MHNPFIILNSEILDAMLRQPMYFVRQHYPRGRQQHDTEKIPLLLTHYGHYEPDKERADRHMRLLYKDPYRFLYDSANPEHYNKLKKAATQPKGYCVYINILSKKWKANDVLKIKIGRYVAANLSCWQYSPADKLNVTLKERYGELFIALLWRGQKTEVLLEDIENFGLCVTT